MFREVQANRLSVKRRSLVCGVGVNDAPYMVVFREGGKRFLCPYYRVWQNMLERCYKTKFHKKQPSYKKCTVCDEWLVFSNFRAWMATQSWQGKDLDKDILFPGNKKYSPETCVFVPHDINMVLCDSAGSRGNLPIGVHEYRPGRFMAQIGTRKNAKHLGIFATPTEAAAAYRKAKHKRLVSLAMQNTGRVREGLLRHAAVWA